MEREQELKKLINVLHRTARTSMRVQWMDVGEDEARFAVAQFNRILARLAEIDANIKTVFEPLPEGSSLTTVAMACRQIVSYYEDEVGVGEEGRHHGFAMDFNIEEVGNLIRDSLQEFFGKERERRAERKHCG
ncbi:MAG: hypothetical protein L0220_19835 [Acidobacteria bacterium]|nr:hypothetical protein [Acidobacteriota bacterium]